MADIKQPELPEPLIDGTRYDETLKICYTGKVHFTADQMHAHYAKGKTDAETVENEWRRLALQFDENRMQARYYLAQLLDYPDISKEKIREFLSAPPLDGEAVLAQRLTALKQSLVQPAQHPDDVAVDRFAQAMKEKLAKKRDEGRGGWDDDSQCDMEDLAEMLIEHIPKGDPTDIANFCMMLHQREQMAIEHHPCHGGSAKIAIQNAWWQNIEDRKQVIEAGPQQPAQAAVPECLSNEFLETVILGICEIPDRNSPEDMPEGMIVTAEELKGIVRSNEEVFHDRGESILARLNAAPEREGGVCESPHNTD